MHGNGSEPQKTAGHKAKPDATGQRHNQSPRPVILRMLSLRARAALGKPIVPAMSPANPDGTPDRQTTRDFWNRLSGADGNFDFCVLSAAASIHFAS